MLEAIKAKIHNSNELATLAGGDEGNQAHGKEHGRLPKAAPQGRHSFAGAKCRQIGLEIMKDEV